MQPGHEEAVDEAHDRAQQHGSNILEAARSRSAGWRRCRPSGPAADPIDRSRAPWRWPASCPAPAPRGSGRSMRTLEMLPGCTNPGVTTETSATTTTIMRSTPRFSKTWKKRTAREAEAPRAGVLAPAGAPKAGGVVMSGAHRGLSHGAGEDVVLAEAGFLQRRHQLAGAQDQAAVCRRGRAPARPTS